MFKELTSDQAFAYGALAAGIKLVTSYPGSPSSGTVETLIPLAEQHDFYIEWSANERIALEMAIGASIAGRRVLVCTKSVGMNVMVDPLMALNLTPVNGGLVILLGDDPGGYGSQNDQDTRPLVTMLEMPLLEPAAPKEAYQIIMQAYDLSEKYKSPFIIRETRSFAQARERVEVNEPQAPIARGYKKDHLRFVPVPKNVVQKHRTLHQTIRAISDWADESDFNRIIGKGKIGVLAAGYTFTKLQEVFGAPIPEGLLILKLTTLYPLPVKTIINFLKQCSKILIIEENEPFVELSVKAIAHDYKCSTEIFGKQSYSISREGELFRWQIQQALQNFFPDLKFKQKYFQDNEKQERPHKKSYCEDCRYDEVLDLLESAASEIQQKLIFIGDPGCLVTVADRLDAKYAIGSAVAVADGISKAGVREKVVALIGDSGFFHSTLPAICNAVHNRSNIVMVVLDNGTTLTSGGQPHPGVPRDAQGKPAPALSIEDISRACGIECIKSFGLDDSKAELRKNISHLLKKQGPTMLIIKIPWTKKSTR